eukprot:4027994-Pleurochrysis_carterae.AAC.1
MSTLKTPLTRHMTCDETRTPIGFIALPHGQLVLGSSKTLPDVLSHFLPCTTIRMHMAWHCTSRLT